MLIALGGLFVLIVVAVVLFSRSSSQFEEEHKSFVMSFTYELSESWDFASLSDVMVSEFVAQLNNPNFARYEETFRSYGKVTAISDLELVKFGAHTGKGSTGIFRFKAKFEWVDALVFVTVVETDEGARIQLFDVRAFSDVSVSTESAA